MLYVFTRNGYALQVDTDSPREAAAAVERGGYGVALETLTETDYRRRYCQVAANRCRHCGELRVICGGWCALPAYAQH